MENKLRWVVFACVVVPQVLMLALAQTSQLTLHPALGYVQASGVLSGLLIMMVVPGAAAEWILGKSVRELRRFCERVKQGKYEIEPGFLLTAWRESKSKGLAAVGRDMIWMAHRIRIREEELQQAVDELQDSQIVLEQQNQALAKANQNLVFTQKCLEQQRKELEEVCREMKHMALTDCLTTIGNRRCFFQSMDAHMKDMCCCPSIALILMDVDHFKKINDQYGHDIGDKVLAELAGIIRMCSREQDLAARIGGEEFTLLLPGTGVGEGIAIAKRIRDAVRQHRVATEKYGKIAVTASFGIAALVKPRHMQRETLYIHADQALYYAKNNGRDSIAVFYGDHRGIEKVS